MRHNIWGNSNVCLNCHRLRDNKVQSTQLICIRIYDLQKVGQYHELQRYRMLLDGVLIAYMMVKKMADLSQTTFVWSTN